MPRLPDGEPDGSPILQKFMQDPALLVRLTYELCPPPGYTSFASLLLNESTDPRRLIDAFLDINDWPTTGDSLHVMRLNALLTLNRVLPSDKPNPYASSGPFVDVLQFPADKPLADAVLLIAQALSLLSETENNNSQIAKFLLLQASEAIDRSVSAPSIRTLTARCIAQANQSIDRYSKDFFARMRAGVRGQASI